MNFPKGVKRKADGTLETYIWATTERRLLDLAEVRLNAGWQMQGRPFRKERLFAAVMVLPDRGGAQKQRKGWQ